MQVGRAASWAWLMCVVSGALFAIGYAFWAASASAAVPPDVRFGWWEALYPLTGLAFSAVGALILTKRPDNRIGWLATAIGILSALSSAADGLGVYATFAHPEFRVVGAWVMWFDSWAYLPPFYLLVVVLPLVFPTGRLLSRRWRWPLAASFIGLSAHIIATALTPDQYGGLNPIRAPIVDTPWLHGLSNAGDAIGTLTGLAGLAAVVHRYRQGGVVDRRRLQWYASALALFVVIALIAAAETYIWRLSQYPFRAPVADILAPVSLAALPIAVGIAILRDRLFDIEMVINRTLVFGTLAAFITSVYLALVAGAGLLVGSTARLNLALSVVATAVVAVAFQPVRNRVERLASRLVYGKDLPAYEMLARFSDAVATAASVDEVLQRTAAALGEAAQADAACVRLFLPAGDERTACWPDDREAAWNETLPLLHNGQLVGEIAFRKPGSEPQTSGRRQVFGSLRVQAGLALRNARLVAELDQRVQQIAAQASALAASRTRIVQAEQTERRRIERNIHDGAQQTVVALIAKLRLARAQLARKPSRTESTLMELQGDAEHLLSDLRELARGIHPAILEDRGLVDAIESRSQRLPIGVHLDVDERVRRSRYGDDIESAAYFVVSEALTNTMKHAHAHKAIVRLALHGSTLSLEVADDGRGFDATSTGRTGLRGLKDRVEAVGGSLRIQSGDEGTLLAADLPARAR